MSAKVSIEAFSNMSMDPNVRGFIHRPDAPSGNGLIFTHGAGGNCQSSLVVAIAEVFSGAGFAVLRCDLPYRQARSYGPPRPGEAARDRLGLKSAVAAMRGAVPGRLFLGGQSYGGRQTTMLCAEEPGLVDGLLLTSYPLHPPGKPAQLRTQHLPKLTIPALFVQGTRDPFATIDEARSAISLIPGKTALLPVENQGHDLGFKGKKRADDLVGLVLSEFEKLFGLA